MKNIMLLAGARPNYMKIFPLWRALQARSATYTVQVTHTGQHYDPVMSDIFFSEFGLPAPDHFLGIGSGSHGQQTGRALEKIEALLMEERPDMLVVVGDVNSTVAGTMAAVKLGIPCAHVEAGLRSFDRTMPEEINRLLTDAIADVLLTPSEDGDTNLLREGVAPERIHRVGNLMIDSLVHMYDRRKKPTLKIESGRYIAVTLHRPFNVDDPKKLYRLLQTFSTLAEDTPVIFPAHPRTRKVIEQMVTSGATHPDFHVVDPMGYLEFLGLTADAGLVLTDSGGLQEETTYLGVPCLTLRPNTERPITISHGTNRLLNPETEDVVALAREAMMSRPKTAPVIPLWDGRAAERTLEVIGQVLK